MKIFRILAHLMAAAFLVMGPISASAGVLAQQPLSLKSGVPPNVMFALSVEFPTAITPAYQDSNQYSRTNTYLGYFDPLKCYTYNNTPSTTSHPSGDTGYFVPISYAGSTSGSTYSFPALPTGVQYACPNSWSGNFLNWATMAGLDEFRFAMTGGNRYIDLASSTAHPGGLTVLQRSYQTGQSTNFIDKSYTDTDGYSTGFGTGAALAIKNGNGTTYGVQMQVSPSGTLSDIAICNTPGGAHGCDGAGAFTLVNSGQPVTCNTWSSSSSYNGSSATKPYECTAFSGGLTSVQSPPGTVAELPTSPGTSATLTATCTGVGYTGSTPSGCTFSLPNGWTPTCAYWLGNGSATQPWTCSTFATSPTNEFFSASSPTIPVPCTNNCSFWSGTAAYTNTNVTCTFPSASSLSGTAVVTSCTSTDGTTTTGTCSAGAYAGSGSSSTPYKCTPSLAVATPAGDTISVTSSSTPIKEGTSSKYFNSVYTFTNSVPGPVYYTTSYAGIYGSTGIYFGSEYSVNDGTTQYYNVRAQVCNPVPPVGVESNCTLYGDGVTWKPTGALQNNGSTMRFGVTSYFMNTGGNSGSTRGTSDIDDAVLRSKLKYLAPQQYLSAGTFTPNAAAEWSATDGTFVNNPDSGDAATMTTPWGTAPANSGVVNYINQFGTTAGYYKTWDDIGKLYYETLKYLRGGNYTGATSGTFTPTPTSDFNNGANQANSDGFPVITTWDDPIKYSCQKNYIITMGDVHTWCDKRLPGGTYSSNGNSVCVSYTDGNGNVHASPGGDMGSLPGDTGISGSINGTTYSIAGTNDATNAVGGLEGISIGAQNMTGAGGASYYMSGLAAWAATNNIRPDLASSGSPMHVSSLVIDVQENQDCAFQKHFWLSAKYGDPTNYTFDPTTGAATWAAGPVNGTNTWSNSIPGNTYSCSSDAPAYPTGAYGNAASMYWPKNLLPAGNPVAMINAVNNAFQKILEQQGAEAALSQSAGTLDTGTGAYIYQGGYTSGVWEGDLQAFMINQTGNVAATPDWQASKLLPNPINRNVYTIKCPSSTVPPNCAYTGTSFAPDSGTNQDTGLSNFDSYEQGLLNKNNLGVTDSLGGDRVRYILGDMSNEAYLPSTSNPPATNTNTAVTTNYGWRSRIAQGVSSSNTTLPYWSNGPTGQLGDIIDSSPVFVGAPSLPLALASYKSFAVTNSTRTPMVYVGANDGMLHAFNAAYAISASGTPTAKTGSGNEVFAYVPYAAYPTLSNLMSPTYSHTFYVDGSPVSGDVCSNGTSACTGGLSDVWQTILVGGMNAGGMGIYALNITDPVGTLGTPFSASNVLWEFTNKDDSDLGYTFSQPIIVQLNNNLWGVIFGNGFNSVDSSGNNPGNNNAYLFVLLVNPNLGGNSGWKLGTNYYKIALPSPGSPNNASNGLAGVAGIDANQDGTVDYVYAGDRNGNMWKIDLTSSTPSAWAASFSNTPLFSAKDASNNPQQITTAPKVGVNPNGGYMVMFGTGSWVDASDTNTTNHDTLYGIWDNNAAVTGRSVLQPQAILGTYSVSVSKTGVVTTSSIPCASVSSTCTNYTIQSSCAPNYAASHTTTNGWLTSTGAANSLCPQFVPQAPAYTSSTSTPLGSPSGTAEQFGWFFDLPGTGERSHSNPPVLTGSTIQFTSLTPTTDPCSGNTSGFEYNFSYQTGEDPSTGIFILPGTTSLATAGTISWIPPGGGPAITVVLSGTSISGGAALNPLTFSATDTAAQNITGVTVTPPAGMPSAAPPACTTGNCTMTNNYYIPGWGFLMNLSSGPSSSTGRVSVTCYNGESGAFICTPRLRTGSFGRLSWKQVN